MLDILPNEQDAQWIQEVLAGETNTFRHLIAKYKSRVTGLAFRLTRSDSELDDLTQEVFIRVFQNLHHYRHEAPFEHWLMRIASNCCRTWLRRQERYSMNIIALEDFREIVDEHHETSLSREEARQTLEYAFSRLSKDERLVVTWLDLEEKSIKEIASYTGWTESNVKVKAHRARRKIGKLLQLRPV